MGPNKIVIDLGFSPRQFCRRYIPEGSARGPLAALLWPPNSKELGYRLIAAPMSDAAFGAGRFSSWLMTLFSLCRGNFVVIVFFPTN